MANLQALTAMLTLQRFTFNDFSENTYLLMNEAGQCVLIDPGCYSKQEQTELNDFIVGSNLTVTQVLNTHCHVDHVLGNYYVKDRYKVPLFIPKGEESVLRAVKVYAPGYGFHHYHEAAVDGFLSEETVLLLGEEPVKILSVPGHSPDHVAFYFENDRILIGGDVLFRESIGRTDLPGGNYETLIKSIHTKFFTLPEDVIVYPGHGPETTIGHEKKFNPFCALTS